MRTIPQLRAVIFDLDDTLIDWGDFHVSEQWEAIERPHLQGVYTYLEQIGQPRGGLNTFKERYFELANSAWFKASETRIAPHMGRILIEAAVKVGVDQTVLDERACLEAYNWSAFDGAQAFPDVFKVLPLLQAHGLALGIVTNAFQPMWMRDIELRDHKLLEFFPSCRFSAADVGYLKPHPNIFNAALNCIGVKPEQAVFVGDNPLDDITGAQIVGMRGVLRKKARRRPRPEVKPDATIRSLEELPRLLDGWYPDWRSNES